MNTAASKPEGYADAVLLAASAMGTRFELVIPRAPGRSEVDLRAVGEAALAEVVRWHGLLSRFEPSSVVALINREAASRSVRVPSEVLDLIAQCESCRLQTGGAFDIAVGQLMDGESDVPLRAEPTVEIDRGASSVRMRRAGVSLDLGGIAKGWALDRAGEVLLEHGIGSALMHGGTSSVMGIGPGWAISVKSGRNGDGLPRVIRVSDQVLSVSAPRGRMSGGEGHIVDPRSGTAATLIDTAATVGGLGQGAMCEAWSTAMVVLGMRPADCPEALETWLHDAAGWRSE